VEILPVSLFSRLKTVVATKQSPVTALPAAASYPAVPFEEYSFSTATVAAAVCLQTNGFVAIRNILDETAVAECRDAFSKLFGVDHSHDGKTQGRSLSNETIFLKALNTRFADAIRSLIGNDVVLVNEMTVHDSMFGGWHTDTTSPEAKGNKQFHLFDDFGIYQCGIYLQDNSMLFGGGLDVVPGTHRRRDPVAAYLEWSKSNQKTPFVHECGSALDHGMSIANLRGDLVVFNLRVLHRATPRALPYRDKEDRKFAYFFVAGPDNKTTRSYRSWLDEYAELQGVSKPSQASAEFSDRLRSMGLRIF
jgi:hypothetical protein